MKAKKRLALMLVCLLLTGCAKSTTTYVMESNLLLPDWVIERTRLVSGAVDNRITKVNIYYDNTKSMYAYGKNANMEGPEGFILAHLITALRDTNSTLKQELTGYESHSYVLGLPDGQKTGTLSWTEMNEDIIRSNFVNQSFYTGSGSGFIQGTLPINGNYKEGPLAMLFGATNIDDDYEYEGEGAFDPKAINVIVTDLQEQNLNIINIATKIYQQVLTQEGYAACIFAMNCSFEGYTYASDPDKLDSDETTLYVDTYRPLYVIMTGADHDLSRYIEKLENNLSQEKEGVTYHKLYYKPGSGAHKISFDEVIVPGAIKIDRTDTAREWDSCEVNKLLFLEEHDSDNIDSLFEVDDYVDIHWFSYNTKNEVGGETDDSGIFVLNYFVPLSTDADGKMVDYDINISYEDGAVESVNIAKNRQEYTKFWYTGTLEENLIEAENEEIKEVKEDTEITERRSRREEENTETERESVEEKSEKGESILSKFNREKEAAREIILSNEWNEDINTRMQIDQQISITSRMLTLKDGLLYDENGDEVLAIIQSELDGNRRLEPEILSLDFNGLLDCSQVLQITVRGNQEYYKGNTILFDIPIYGVQEDGMDLDDWIDSFDADGFDGYDNGNVDFAEHTYRFSDFCKELIGKTTLNNEKLNNPGRFKAERSAFLIDIVTVITDLPIDTRSEK